ncbi:CDP-diacylglycerol--glycerol-3-phosphate 3-phosphatidyltransferase [Pelagivirga sediminicola]|uniref:CDP-diacylglycerol--glycerol-3-phosphate 3-phosphatidyltransferase n=1 Tax=Pelagivirga sediminicola TaxID=2170575 RepID=A0A2T7G3X9_9RHOB|nr:CDP-diacylglycerol--glycerol-3-phosphate 3-phosphatidyltransferase [Pelagivirga sediminicola]PVA09122.1 CDP-diacylglycerol--glycerol-3-phosphate 3-phosphatidyltransferase [Pelagivirga sediminicola]
MADLKNRRPLGSRDTKWAARGAALLAARGAAPNAISQASMVAALVAALAFAGTARTGGAGADAALLILGALGCQIRLLCNLFDGMVAVEAGQSAPDGPLWNEWPDRVSDLLILFGAGIGAGHPALGLAAGAMAVLAAYTRELGASIGLAPDFTGPMAKPQRMAAITIAALIALFEPLFAAPGTVLTAALWIVALGAALTSVRRAARIRAGLLARG